MKKKLSLKELKNNNDKCCDPKTGCYTQPSTIGSRRKFMKMATLAAEAFTLPAFPVFAGPFEFDDNEHLIPKDKKLSAEWIKSLYKNGVPEVYTTEKNQLNMEYGQLRINTISVGVNGISDYVELLIYDEVAASKIEFIPGKCVVSFEEKALKPGDSFILNLRRLNLED